MSRSRASIPGGYVRKTVSLPADLVERIDDHLAKHPGLTLSAFMTQASNDQLVLLDYGKSKRKR